MDEVTLSELQAQLAVASEALRHADQRASAGQLALELMHEIRNPLEALGHLAYLAGESAEQPGDVRTYMSLAEEQLATLNQIVSQTLGFAKFTSRKPADLADLAEAALRIHRHKMEAGGIHLVRDFHQGVVASVHMGEILQVVSNLIVNALDALPASGKLHIRLRKRGKQVHIVIADNGHGIAAEHLARVFHPFFTTKGDQGTGLGLALSKQIIERHNGSIRARSSARPGTSGTCFQISLPA